MKTQEKFALLMIGTIATIAFLVAPTISNAMPGDMLDQALHQSMREHSSAQKELAASGMTRVEDNETKPSVEADGIRIVVGQGEILADTYVSAGLAASPLKATHARLGIAEPTRMGASAGISEQENSESLTADQELLDPAP